MSTSTTEPLFVLTNDDGPYTEGLRMVRGLLEKFGRVLTVVPNQEMSGSSHALTLNRPLQVTEVEPDFYVVSGTPADCTYMALFHLLKERKPDLIVSGLNNGYNMGEDVIYSGTVAGAMEGYFHGVSGIALSARNFRNIDQVHDHVRAIFPRVRTLPGTFLLNINYPTTAIKGTRMTRLSSRVYPGNVEPCDISRPQELLWIGGVPPVWSDREGTDIAAVMAGYASVTPLKPDLTDTDFLSEYGSCFVD